MNSTAAIVACGIIILAVVVIFVWQKRRDDKRHRASATYKDATNRHYEDNGRYEVLPPVSDQAVKRM